MTRGQKVLTAHIVVGLLIVGAYFALTAGGSELEPLIEKTDPPIDVERCGSIAGVATYEGPEPKPDPFAMSADCLKYHKDNQAPPVDSLVVTDGKLKNVFVVLHKGPGLEKRVFATRKEPAMVNNVGCTYDPHVVGVMRLQPVEITSADEVEHNVHWNGTGRNASNVNLSGRGQSAVRQFVDREPDYMVRVKCDKHGWMVGWIGVVEHPYFAVTKADGTYAMKDVPEGEYEVLAWHEVLGKQTAKVTIEPKKAAALDFTFKK